MKLPAIFKQDIQSKNIQLIPLLIIERDSSYDDFAYNSQSIFLSTHDINIEHSDPYQADSFENGMYFPPLLLDNPVISEKIDVENRKYTISKCKFKISNNPYNGQRFSDILNTDSLIGKKVNFSYKSINSSLPVSSMFLDSQGLSSWADLYDENEYISPTFYFGEIRDITHNNEVVTITAEDLGSSFLHQELPKNSLPTNTSVLEHYRGAKIPMVYGYVPKSPVVMGVNNKIYTDSRPIQGWFKNNINNPARYNYPFDNEDFGALFINIDDHYCCVADTIKYKLADNSNRSSVETYFDFRGYDNEPMQVEYIEDDIYDSTQVAKLVDNPLLSMKSLQLMVAYKPSKISLLQRVSEAVTWNDSLAYPERFSLGDSDYFWESEDNLLEQESEYMTDSNYESTIDVAENDDAMPNRAEAMINSVNPHHVEDNKWKHALFRFVINTEPPIEYINRGGISRNGNYGTYWHWISFGHWVMPEQSVNDPDTSHHIYTYAKRGMGTGDESWESIRRRFREQYYTDDEDEDWYYDAYSSYMLSDAITDSFGNTIYLGDIIRFPDFNDHPDFNPINPEQVDWHTFEAGAKSPLQYYDASTIDETAGGNYIYEYTNPFAKFTNQAHKGKYIVDIGTYGWISNINQSTSPDGWQTPTGGTTPGGTFGGFIYGVSRNFDYFGRLKGWLPEVNCLSVCDAKVTFQDMFGSVGGRVDVNDNMIKHPSDIIADIFVNELGYSTDKIDTESLASTKEINSHSNWEFCFTQKDAISSKDLIEDIAKSTFMFPRIGFDGTLKFSQIKRNYNIDDFNNSILIDDLDIISYSYNLTKRDDLRTKTDIEYNYDYKSENYFGDVVSKDYKGDNVLSQIVVPEEHLEFHGLDNIEDNKKEFKSKYMRTELNYDPGLESNFQISTIRAYQNMATHHYRNRHLIIKCKLPLRYLDIDVGEYVRFNNLIDGAKAYGIDYSKMVEVNNQHLYPLFICTNIKKTIEYVEIECMQLHDLRFATDSFDAPDNFWFGEDEEEPVDDDVVFEGFMLDSFYQAQYSYTTFDLVSGEAEYPYYASADSQALFIMDEEGGYNFGDEGSGIHELFSTEHFQVKYSDSDQFVNVQNWNDLLPGEFTTTNSSNINYTILEIVHRNNNIGFNYTYKLKNMQTNIGDPIEIGWEITINQSDEDFNNGFILASPFIDSIYPGGEFIFKNKSNYSVRYSSPHPIDISEVYESDHFSVGDVNFDGTINILDIVSMINYVAYANQSDMTDEEFSAADINADGMVNILDIIILVNILLDNE